MSPKKPLISVILPLYNAEAYVAEAIRSVQAQAITDWEIICVDDGSTDDSVNRVTALNEPRLKLIQQPNQGPSAARNRALDVAVGEYIAFIDADDTWPADKLAQQLSVLTANELVDAVVGLVQYVFEHQVLPPAYRFSHDDNRTLYYQLGAGLFRRSVFARVGPFNESLRHSEDVDWYMRLKEQNVRLQTLEQTTLLYRVHGRNMTTGYDPSNNGITQVLRDSLTRRRQQGAATQLRNFQDYESMP